VSISLRILASGSAGNCSIVRTPAGVIMIDAGLSPRATADRLDGTGVSLDDIKAICLTHLDGDHYQSGWGKFIVERKIKVFCSDRNRREMVTRDNHPFAPLVKGVDFNVFEPVPRLCASAVELRHDTEGSTGFRFDCNGNALGYATDLGRVPASLIEAFAGVDLLAIESNYDLSMQLQSARPAFLKNRIMGGRGHLSNAECYSAARKIFDVSQQHHGRLPSHLVLLHRSRECNCPHLLRRFFERDARFAHRLTLAEQHSPTPWLNPIARPKAPGEQMFFGWPQPAPTPAWSPVSSPA